jgi:membrane protein implicated in regulation of membrane protease activity
VALLWSLPATLALSMAGTRAFALLFARVFRSSQAVAVKRNDLVGRTGQVVYSVNSDEGTVHVRDPDGCLQRVRARSLHGPFDPGTQVIVLGYDPQSNLYEVDDSTRFVER